MSAVPGTSRPAPAASAVLPGTWAVVPDAGTARFSVRDKLVATARGTMPVVDGRVVVSDAGEVVEGWVTVSVAGIATGNARRDRDLRKAHFLDAAGHPTVRVEVGAVTPTSSGGTAEGTVHARGAAAPVELVAELVEASASRLRIRVTGTLDRGPLGIKAPTFLVGRDVQLDADLVLDRQSG